MIAILAKFYSLIRKRRITDGMPSEPARGGVAAAAAGLGDYAAAGDVDNDHCHRDTDGHRRKLLFRREEFPDHRRYTSSMGCSAGEQGIFGLLDLDGDRHDHRPAVRLRVEELRDGLTHRLVHD
jgi:hypothetical protein